MDVGDKVIRILLIDDDQDDQFFFLEALQKVNSRAICDWASNGEAGLAKLKSATMPPDYIFVDLNMPRMSGMQVLKAIKDTPAIAYLPVIIYSTSENQDDMLQAKNLGAAHYISKPNSLASLEKIIERLLSGHSKT